jgi:hypothetical protein
MSRLPKVKIKLPSGKPSEYICELAQARDYLNFNEGVFMVEGQGLQSYEDLIRIASQEKYRDKEYIVVEWLQIVGGG